MIEIKRAYDPPARGDGQRVLVERLWPRGKKKDELALDGWLKDVAPSTELRKWFGHRVERWPEFRRRYLRELSHNKDLETLVALARRGKLTLVYGSADTEHNSALVLREYLVTASSRRRTGVPQR